MVMSADGMLRNYSFQGWLHKGNTSQTIHDGSYSYMYSSIPTHIEVISVGLVLSTTKMMVSWKCMNLHAYTNCTVHVVFTCT